jgi:hypothetical protein
MRRQGWTTWRPRRRAGEGEEVMVEGEKVGEEEGGEGIFYYRFEGHKWSISYVFSIRFQMLHTQCLA